jgi:hypothetical protein
MKSTNPAAIKPFNSREPASPNLVTIIDATDPPAENKTWKFGRK